MVSTGGSPSPVASPPTTWSSSTRAAWPSITRPSTRTSAWCPTRRSSPRSRAGRRPMPALAQRVEVVPARPGRLRRAPKADLSLYHVGNDPEAHAWIVAELRRRPGSVVLHDFVLHHLVAGLTLARGDSRGYLDALEREQ